MVTAVDRESHMPQPLIGLVGPITLATTNNVLTKQLALAKSQNEFVRTHTQGPCPKPASRINTR